MNDSIVMAQVKVEEKVIETTSNSNYNLIKTNNGSLLLKDKDVVILVLHYSSLPDVFLAQKGAISGVAIKKGEDLFFEYLENGKVVKETFLVSQ
jgi:hypothetical protein